MSQKRLFTGQTPEELRARIVKTQLPSFPAAPVELEFVFRGLLERNPKKRLCAQGALDTFVGPQHHGEGVLLGSPKNRANPAASTLKIDGSVPDQEEFTAKDAASSSTDAVRAEEGKTEQPVGSEPWPVDGERSQEWWPTWADVVAGWEELVQAVGDCGCCFGRRRGH